MILLDTHVWVWWVHGSEKLGAKAIDFLDEQPPNSIAVSVISCWEVAQLCSRGKLELPKPIEEWTRTALGYPGVFLAPITVEVAVNSCQLPEPIHKDPADRFLIATAKALDCPLVTADQEILNYPHCQTLNPDDLPTS